MNTISALAFFCLSAIAAKGQINLTSVSEQSQFLAIYRLVYHPDSTSLTNKTEYLRLTIGKTLSKFESEGFASRDSLLKIGFNPNTPGAAQSMINIVSALPHTNFKYTIYKNFINNKIYCYDRIGYGSLYIYEEPESVFKWNILPNQKSVISGFNCQKATTVYAGRIYEAWFTREIPIPEGPYKFYGLPGLIVNISDVKHQYSFQLVKFLKSATPVTIALPTKPAEATTRAELHQAQIDDALSQLDRLAAMGNNVTAEEKKAKRDKVKRENNPLELR